MNLDELQSVQARERQSSDLQHLRASFYREVGEFIGELSAERAEAVEAAEDPFASSEVRRISDDIETAEQTVEAIYERRVGKVVKKASIAAAGMPVDDDGLTDEEAALFDDLVARIQRNRETVLAALDGEATDVSPDVDAAATDDGVPGPSAPPSNGTIPGDAGGPDALDPRPDDTGGDGDRRDGASDDDDGNEGVDSDDPPDQGVSAADLMGEPDADQTPAATPEETSEGPDPSTDAGDDATAASEGTDPPVPDPGELADDADPSVDAGPDDGPDATGAGDEVPGLPRTTVRITADVGEVVGADDRDYDLSADDVVTLPAPNAEVLLDKGAAERLE